MKALRNHPGLSLQDDAADALTRFEAAHGVQPITSAYRSPAVQQGLIDRWNKGGRLNRPPYLYEPASIKKSKHISGLAIDTSNPAAFHKWGPAFGFFFNYAYDTVHFEYDSKRDPSKPKPTPAPVKSKRPTIKRGARGANVLALQDRLNGRYPAYSRLKRDSVFGPSVEATVKEFQRRSGLVPDGIVGAQTWAALGL